MYIRELVQVQHDDVIQSDLPRELLLSITLWI